MLKVSVKWGLSDGIPFNEILMGWIVIVESKSKTFSTTCVLFWIWFSRKMVHKIAWIRVQVIELDAIFSYCTDRSKYFGSYDMFPYFALVPPHDNIYDKIRQCICFLSS